MENNINEDLFVYIFGEEWAENLKGKQGDVLWLVDEAKQNNIIEHDWMVFNARFLNERENSFRKLLNDENQRRRSFFYHLLKTENRYKKSQNEKTKEHYYIDEETICKMRNIADQTAFDTLQEDCLIMAKKGYPKAIAMYLSHTQPKKQDKTVLDFAQQIAAKKVKTPEEWEVVASLDFHKPVHISFEYTIDHTKKFKSYDVNNKRDLVSYAALAYKLNYIACECGEENNYNQTGNEYFNLIFAIRGTDYYHCIQKALLGYYARYFSSEFAKTKYLDDYMFLQKETKFIFADLKAFSKYSNGKNFNFEDLNKIMQKTKFQKDKNFRKKVKIEEVLKLFYENMNDYSTNISDRLAQARYLAFYSPDKKKKEVGFSKLRKLSEVPYLMEELQHLKRGKFSSFVEKIATNIQQEEEKTKTSKFKT